MRRASAGWVVLALVLSAPARGQEDAESGEAAGPEPEAEEIEEQRARTFTVTGSVGLITYAGEAAQVTSPGATYGVSAGIDLGRGVNAELGYVGASYGVEGSSVGIAENGARALAKIGPEYGRFSPYALWGFEAKRLNVVGADSAGGVQDATMFHLPVGAGFDVALQSQGAADITLGLRAAYSFTLDAGAFPGLGEPSAANQFQTTVGVGGRF